MKNWQNSRDVILFFGGLAGVFNETALNTTERPTLLILFAAMMGLPAFLRQDDKNQLPPPEEEDQETMVERRLAEKRASIREAMKNKGGG
jgi:choline-glycine betaine transporter